MIKVSEPAKAEVTKLLGQEGRGPNHFVRVGVKGGGCSGYYYVYDVATKRGKRDLVFDFDGLRVFVDDRSAALLAGGELDWETRLMGYGFKWKNPNATGDCGCGSRFTTD
mgnify:CR=1 FL=1